MIPSLLDRQLQRGVAHFLETQISSSIRLFHSGLEEFLDRGEILFKGPYLSIDIRFRKSEVEGEYFPKVPLGFTPYLHQYRTFERPLGPRLNSTLISADTGSGKTEAFLCADS